MKRFGNLVGQIADFDNLALAFHKAQKGKKAQKEVVAYREKLHENLRILSEQIMTGNVDVGDYRHFTIIDPKKREICAAAFGERVLHHAVMNVCDPFFERNLIFDTYATRKDKGVYAALEKAHKAMPKYAYVAKLDVRKYFDSISHNILKSLLERLFKDRVLLTILGKIIDSYQTVPSKGLPIGNLTSQYFANFYLSGLDHYAKEVLRVPVYIRYMDDILLFAEKKDDVFEFTHGIVAYANCNLGLELKPPVIIKTSQSVSFLGYRLHGHSIALNGRSRKRFLRKMRLYGNLLRNDKWDERTYFEHITPLLSFVLWAYTKQYRRRVMQTTEGQRL